MRESIFLLQNGTDTNALEVIGKPVRGDRWVLMMKNHIYTYAIHNSNFSGTAYLEGSLVESPTDSDWFSIITPIVFDSWTSYAPAIGGSFTGIYTWIRARTVSNPPVNFPGYVGFIDRVLLNF